MQPLIDRNQIGWPEGTAMATSAPIEETLCIRIWPALKAVLFEEDFKPAKSGRLLRPPLPPAHDHFLNCKQR